MTGKRRRLVGEERKAVAEELAKRYGEGENIRQLVSSTGHSYGTVHRLLAKSGVLRQHGGDRRSAADAAQLVATLAALFPGEKLSVGQAWEVLRDMHGTCSDRRASAAARQHNEQVARAGEAG